LTATHLIFIDPEGKRETWVSFEIKNLFTKKQSFIFIFLDSSFSHIRC
jgi:hypothetical protein